jgi:hypothetical protein
MVTYGSKVIGNLKYRWLLSFTDMLLTEGQNIHGFCDKHNKISFEIVNL